jgi:hypothetical protein
MAPQTYISEAHSETKEFLRRLGEYVEVPWEEYRTSDKPLASFSYASCSGLVMMNGTMSSLIHLRGEQATSPEKARLLIQEMMSTLGRDITCLLDLRKGAGPISSLCADNGLGVQVEQTHSGFYTRDIVVIPAEREVRIFTNIRPVEIHRLD